MHPPSSATGRCHVVPRSADRPSPPPAAGRRRAPPHSRPPPAATPRGSRVPDRRPGRRREPDRPGTSDRPAAAADSRGSPALVSVERPEHSELFRPEPDIHPHVRAAPGRRHHQHARPAPPSTKSGPRSRLRTCSRASRRTGLRRNRLAGGGRRPVAEAWEGTVGQNRRRSPSGAVRPARTNASTSVSIGGSHGAHASLPDSGGRTQRAGAVFAPRGGRGT